MSKYYIDSRGNLRCEELENREVRASFRNFSGVHRTKYPNPDNKRFCVFISDKDFALWLIEEGWPLKIYVPKKRDELGNLVQDQDADVEYYLEVKVKFKDKFGRPHRNPPEMFIYSNGIRTKVGEEFCTVLSDDEDGRSEMDKAYFESIILEINLGTNKETGAKSAYLKRFDGKLPDNPYESAADAWVKQSGE